MSYNYPYCSWTKLYSFELIKHQDQWLGLKGIFANVPTEDKAKGRLNVIVVVSDKIS